MKNTSIKLTQLSLAIALTLSAAGCSNMTPTKRMANNVGADTAVEQPIMQSVIFPFAESIVPENVEARPGSVVSMSDTRYIMGEHSLKWDWTANSAFIVRQPIRLITDAQAHKAWGRRSTQVLSFWIYNETAIDDDVVVDLGRGLGGSAMADAGFSVNMNFTGWRAVGVSLANDIQGREIEGIGISDSSDGEGLGATSIAGSVRSDMDTIRFTAPASIAQGTFYVDRIMLSVDDARYQWSDEQVKTRITVPEIDFKLPKQLPIATESEIIASEQIRESLVDVFTSINGEVGLKISDDMDKIRSDFAEFDIKRDELGNLSGRHLINNKQKILYQPSYLQEKDKALFDEYASFGKFSTLLFNIGRAWNNSDSTDDKRELADMYTLMTEFMIDQGYADGSAVVTTHHWGYYSRWWYISAMLMQETLAEHQLQRPIFDALLWYSREFKVNFEMNTGPESSNLDYFNTLSRQHLALLMLETDMNRRVALLTKFGKFIDFALSQTPPGGHDGLRPDGTAWRHEGNYPGYSFPAFKNAAQLVYMLNGTPFEVGKEGRKSLKKAMLSAWIYSNPEVGIGLSGRHPLNPPSIRSFQDSLRWLALSGDLVGDGTVDKELAAAYLQVTGKNADESVALFGERIEPADMQQGYWAFNGGAFGIHRYKDKMVTMKGYNSNVWSSEIYQKNNRYGRYQSHGAVQVVPYGDQRKIGFVQEGWDWNRNPGATTIHLPLDRLDSPNTHTLMLRGDQPFSGASSLENQYGMFAFKHQAPNMDKFIPSFSMNKTTFSADNHLVMLGSDIENSSDEFKTETTLFQHAITSEAKSIWVNGEEVTSLPYQAQLGKGDWLIDGHGNGYLMVSDSIVEVRRQHQHSAHNQNKKPTEGDFTVAWIDHGVEPDDVSYEYLTILDATPESMAILAKDLVSGEKPYTVLNQDKTAHVVFDKKTNVTAYTAFSSGSFDNDIVKSIDSPAIVMTRKINDSEVTISAVAPDLNMTRYTAAKPMQIPVTLSGLWQVKTANEKVSISNNGSDTQLSFTSYFGIPQEVTLIKK